MTSPPDTPYDRAFYDRTHDGSARSAAVIVPLVMELLHPRSVIDVGSGSGAWLREFADRGVADLTGLDGPWATPSGAPYTFIEADLAQPFPLPRTFDLAVSLEVAEHLPATSMTGFVQSLVGLSTAVLFSAAIPHQGGVDHVNEQWPDAWAQLFAAHGYVPIDCVRPRVWKDAAVEWWYAQNTLLYVSAGLLRQSGALQAAAARTDSTRLNVVHPSGYLQQVRMRHAAALNPDADRLPARTLIALAPRVLLRAIRRTFTR
jgi:SAM-dependent methyltransferase